MENKDYVTYEYCTKKVKLTDQAKMIDFYEAFGWEITTMDKTFDGVLLSFKRDRKLQHKQELSRLERKAEEHAALLKQFEQSKTRGATIFTVLFGILSVLILGGGMSMTLLEEYRLSFLVVGIILGVLGMVLCVINYFIYKKMVDRKTHQVLPLIDEQNEQLANILEQGNSLLMTNDIV